MTKSVAQISHGNKGNIKTVKNSFGLTIDFVKTQISQECNVNNFDDLQQTKDDDHFNLYNDFSKWVDRRGKQLDEMLFYASIDAYEKIPRALEHYVEDEEIPRL